MQTEMFREYAIDFVRKIREIRRKYTSLVEEVRKIREDSLENLFSYLDNAIKNFEKNGINVFFCKDSDEARKIIKEIVGDEKIVVKSKTNVGNEINLKEFLRNNGTEVVETDCGDFIVDLCEEKPSHPVLPALHISLEKIAEKLKEKYNIDIELDENRIKEKIREIIFNKIREARVGITGANFFTSDGSLVILENEGNISLVSRKEKHIVITSIEKVVKDVSSAIKCAIVQSLFATGQYLTSYCNIITSCSKTADIGGKLLKGMYGSKDVYVLILDNGRSKLYDSEFKEVLKCINCGACLYLCPIFWQLSNEFGFELKGGKNIILQSSQKDLKKLFEKAFYCIGCNYCKEVCPVGIDTPKLMKRLRRKIVESGFIYDSDRIALENIIKYGNPIGKVEGKLPDKLYCC